MEVIVEVRFGLDLRRVIITISNIILTYTIIDINECQVSQGNCSHNCINNFGSYRCTCPSGYYLGIDGKTCQGSLSHKQEICMLWISHTTKTNSTQKLENLKSKKVYILQI